MNILSFLVSSSFALSLTNYSNTTSPSPSCTFNGNDTFSCAIDKNIMCKLHDKEVKIFMNFGKKTCGKTKTWHCRPKKCETTKTVTLPPVVSTSTVTETSTETSTVTLPPVVSISTIFETSTVTLPPVVSISTIVETSTVTLPPVVSTSTVISTTTEIVTSTVTETAPCTTDRVRDIVIPEPTPSIEVPISTIYITQQIIPTPTLINTVYITPTPIVTTGVRDITVPEPTLTVEVPCPEETCPEETPVTTGVRDITVPEPTPTDVTTEEPCPEETSSINNYPSLVDTTTEITATTTIVEFVPEFTQIA